MNINELEQLAKAATPGPWESEQIEDVHAIAWIGKIGIFPIDGTQHREWPDTIHDAAYIAAANPPAILELIAAYREAVAALWICAKHNELFHGKEHNTVIGSLHALATAKRLGVE